MAGRVIRRATHDDVGAIVRMTFDLAHATRQPLPLSAPRVAGFVAQCLSSEQALALVAGEPVGGFLVATVAETPLSPIRVGVEHGWWCGPGARGAGLSLLAAYEAWARGLGLYAIRMSTPAPAASGGLARRGFAPVEQAWIKVL